MSLKHALITQVSVHMIPGFLPLFKHIPLALLEISSLLGVYSKDGIVRCKSDAALIHRMNLVHLP